MLSSPFTPFRGESYLIRINANQVLECFMERQWME